MSIVLHSITIFVLALHSIVGDGVKCTASTFYAFSACKKSSNLAYIQTLFGPDIFCFPSHPTCALRRNFACGPRFFQPPKIGSFYTVEKLNAVHSISLYAAPRIRLSHADPVWNESKSIPFFPLSELIRLDKELKIAVHEERYETASAIRDEIRSLRERDEITRLRLVLDDSVAGVHSRYSYPATSNPAMYQSGLFPSSSSFT